MMPRTIPAVALALAFGCGGSGCGTSGSESTSGPGDTPNPGNASGPGATGSQTPTPGSSAEACALATALGKDHLLIGVSAGDAAAVAAPYDIRYLYIAGGIADGAGPCTSCDGSCTATNHGADPPETKPCDNAHGGCAWWGCWQWDQVPPGDYARGFIGKVKAAGSQIPMLTYYELLQSMPGLVWDNEGEPEVLQVEDVSFMSRYLADWRFLLQQVGNEPALLHVEPDFWGYAQHHAIENGIACSGIPAAVASANPADCGSYPNTLAGMGQCMIAMARKYAPNAKVGLHASGWGTRIDVLMNDDPALDVAGEAGKLGEFLVGCGAGGGDFVVADMSDRDAGYYESRGRDAWWDPTNATLPHFHQAFTWGQAVAETVGLPLLWWQVPVGNMAQDDTTNHWKDNRVDYVFGHVSELVASHAVGIAFGAGEGAQTTPETDGGNLASRTNAYASGGAKLCP